MDLIVFAFGVAAGAAAMFVPWLSGPYKRYVVNCGKASCPHHGEQNLRHLAEVNERERHEPPQPPRMSL